MFNPHPNLADEVNRGIIQCTATISAPLAGANGFTKTGFGTLVLSGSNSLSGTLYVDTATSAAVNDGAVCIARSASVANVASPIYLKNNNSGSSTLQFDGSGGDVTVAQNISLAGRNVAVIAIQNLAGSNTLAGNFILTSGGQYYWLDSESGTRQQRHRRHRADDPTLPRGAWRVPNGI